MVFDLTGTGYTISGGPLMLTGSDITTNAAAMISAAVGGSSGLTKLGLAALTLSGSNNYTGTTSINAGTLLLGNDNVLPDQPMTLVGGTLGTGGFDDTVGALTLAANSIIDMGAGSSVLHFANSSAAAWTGTLSVYNWTGNLTGGGTDQLFAGNSASGLTATQLSQISFFSGSGTGFLGKGGILANGEVVVAVPEPSTILGGACLLGLVSYRERRRLRFFAAAAVAGA